LVPRLRHKTGHNSRFSQLRILFKPVVDFPLENLYFSRKYAVPKFATDEKRRNVTSNTMTTYRLKDIDSFDIEDLLVEIEKSFGIKFSENELNQKTFGELCDYIANKIELENVDDCTSQQAFYKLREAISTTLVLDNKTISPSLPLSKVLPRNNRRRNVKELESYLGFKLKILRAPIWVSSTFIIVILVSIVSMFFSWRFGILGMVFSICGLRLSSKFGKELDLKTVGEVAEKITRENYLKSRRNQNTFNRNEIEKVLTNWFAQDLGLEKSELTRDAQFV
jgi:acyl carrier protein